MGPPGPGCQCDTCRIGLYEQTIFVPQAPAGHAQQDTTNVADISSSAEVAEGLYGAEDLEGVDFSGLTHLLTTPEHMEGQ